MDKPKSKKSNPNQDFTGVLAFLRSVRVELGLVKWPSRQETLRLTTIVIVVSILVAAYIGGLDYLFTTLITNLITH